LYFFANPALSWWNGHVQTIVITTANFMSWDDAFRGARQARLSKRGPFEILDRIGPIAYQLSLPSELSNVQDVSTILTRRSVS